MSYGFVVFNDNNFLLVSSDSPTYEYVRASAPHTRTGNVNKYTVQANTVPLILTDQGLGKSAGILSVIQTTAPTSTQLGTYEVEILADVNCNIGVFTPINSNTVSGTYGLAVYNEAGKLTFATDRKLLQVVDAGIISSSNPGIPVSSGIDISSFVAATVKPSKSDANRSVLVSAYVVPENKYICQYVYVYPPPFYDPFLGFIYSPPYLDYQCSFQWVNITYYVNANINRTSWSIERSTLQLNSGSVKVKFLVHKSGYYDTVTSYSYYNSYNGPGQVTANLPQGYTVPASWVTANVTVQGELNTTNTYPYAAGTTVYNDIPVTFLTSRRSTLL